MGITRIIGNKHGASGKIPAKALSIRQEPRIVRIDDFAIDAVPSGYLLFTRNVDQPGVIGTMGTLLANQGVNIARMHLGRDEKKREAIALINVDSELTPAGIEALRKAKGMLSVKQIHL